MKNQIGSVSPLQTMVLKCQMRLPDDFKEINGLLLLLLDKGRPHSIQNYYLLEFTD